MLKFLRRLVIIVPLLAFISLVVPFAISLGRDPTALPSVMVDHEAPSFALPALISGTAPLANADLRGRPVLINFFASWCAPCQVEHPQLTALAASGVPVYGISWKDRPEDTTRFLNQLGNPFRNVGVDRSGRLGIDFGVYGVPETYVIDATGRVRYRHAGPLLPNDVETIIKPMLKQLSR